MTFNFFLTHFLFVLKGLKLNLFYNIITQLHCKQKMALQLGIPICPITFEVMREPVIDHEGNTYEKSAILEWIQRDHRSPITRNPLSAEQLIPNRALLEYYNTNSNIIQITNCSTCHKSMKVSNYKGHKILCYSCRDWACKLCTYNNKYNMMACEMCEVMR